MSSQIINSVAAFSVADTLTAPCNLYDLARTGAISALHAETGARLEEIRRQPDGLKLISPLFATSTIRQSIALIENFLLQAL